MTDIMDNVGPKCLKISPIQYRDVLNNVIDFTQASNKI